MAGDLVYSEADLIEQRDRWERAAKDREWTNQLAIITGQLTGMPDLIRSISREVAATVVADVLKNQKDQQSKQFGVRWDRWATTFQLSLISAGLFYEIFFKH